MDSTPADRLFEVIEQVVSSRDDASTQCFSQLATYIGHDPSLAFTLSKRSEVLNSAGNLLVTARTPEAQVAAIHLMAQLMGYPVRCRRFVNVFGKHEKLRAMVHYLHSSYTRSLAVRTLQRLMWHDEGAGVICGVLLSAPLMQELVKGMHLYLDEVGPLFSYLYQSASHNMRQDVVSKTGVLQGLLGVLSHDTSPRILEVIACLARGNNKAIALCLSSRELSSFAGMHANNEFTQLLHCVVGGPAGSAEKHLYTELIAATENIRKCMYDVNATIRAMQRIGVVAATPSTFLSTVLIALPEILSTLLVCLNNVDEGICSTACGVLEAVVVVHPDVAQSVVDLGAVETVCGIILDEDTRMQVRGTALLGTILEVVPKASAYATKSVAAVVRVLSAYCDGSVVSAWSELHVHAIVSALRVLRVNVADCHPMETLFQILHKGVAQNLESVVALCVECLRWRAQHVTTTNVQYVITLLSKGAGSQNASLARCVVALLGYITKADHSHAFVAQLHSQECASALFAWVSEPESVEVVLRVVGLILTHYDRNPQAQQMYLNTFGNTVMEPKDGAAQYALSAMCNGNLVVQSLVLRCPAVIIGILTTLQPRQDVEEIGCALALTRSLVQTLSTHPPFLEEHALPLVCALVEIIAYYEYEAPQAGGDVPQRCFQLLVELRDISCPVILNIVRSVSAGLLRRDGWPAPLIELPPADLGDPDEIHDNLIKVLPLINGFAHKDVACRQCLLKFGVVDIVLELLARDPLEIDLLLTAVYVLHNLGVSFTSTQSLLATHCVRTMEECREAVSGDYSANSDDVTRRCLLYSDVIGTLGKLLQQSFTPE